jgi:hypothetical protein
LAAFFFSASNGCCGRTIDVGPLRAERNVRS